MGEGGHRTAVIIHNPAMDGDLGDGKGRSSGVSLSSAVNSKGSDAFSLPLLQYQFTDGHDRFLIIHIRDEDPERSQTGLCSLIS